MTIIGIDGNEANIEKRVGVGRYAYELLRQFAKFQISNFKFQIYLKEPLLPDLPKETEWWKYKIVGPRRLWTQIGLPIALFQDRPQVFQVFFTPTHYAPRFCPCPRVISIMDLSFLPFPKMFKKKDLWQLKNWTAYSVKKAAKILTISKATKDDIIKYYQVPEEKVVVTYPGYDMTKIKDQRSTHSASSGLILSQVEGSKIKDIKEKYRITGDYILSVGTLQPRKNFVRLIEAFSKILNQVQNDKGQGQNDSLELVIVGKKGWLYEEILEAPKKFGVEAEVKFLDYVPDSDLPALYQNAKCFVLVSLYEGFGLPVLEAMANGCPVAVSNTSSLPEVVGEAGILVNPHSVEEICDGLLKVLKLGDKERQEMIEKGLKQAKKFSWEKCARETLEVLKEVAKG